MKNSEYWEERIANETWTVYNTLEEKNRALMDMYQEATLDIQNELYSIAQKVNGGQSLSLSDMHKYNRLKSLQNNIENRIEQLGKDTEKFGKDNMKEGFKEVYSNIRKELGETSFSMPNEKVMLKMMNNPWQGSNFSKRLWKNTGVLASNLNEILTIGLTQGKTVTEMAIQLGNRMNQSFNTAHKLIRTETMHYLNESAYKAYKDGGCEEVQLWAAEDERTCEVCGKRHGKKYKIDKRPVLPFHPNCRCTLIPVIDLKKVEENNKVIKEQNKKIKKLNDISRLQDLKGPLPKRHVLTSINNNSKPKDKNTIILPGVNYTGDIERIKNGEYNKINGNYEINGRTYGIHDRRLYPISGDGFVTLTRHEYKVLIIIKTQANNPILDTILDNVGATKEEIRKVKNILSKLR